MNQSDMIELLKKVNNAEARLAILRARAEQLEIEYEEEKQVQHSIQVEKKIREDAVLIANSNLASWTTHINTDRFHQVENELRDVNKQIIEQEELLVE